MKKLFIMAIVLFSCGAISLAFKNAHPGYAAPGQNNQVIFNPDDAKKEVEAGNKLFMESVAKP